jgi:diacylglycerol kinase (ATP)
MRAIHALRYSCNGILTTLRTESAFRQETCAALVLLPLAAFAPVGAVERVLLATSVLLVLLVELLNSAIEAVVDRISLERHELSRRAKDCGSAAVLVSLAMWAVTWGTIGGPLLWHTLANRG